MARMVEKYSLNQCVFYKLKSKRKLAHYLKVDLNTLKEVEDLVSYNTFSLKLEGKKDRDITAPNQKLKSIQKRIHMLLIRVERPQWLISGERGKSYVDNAKMHQLSNYALTMDIKGFYNNTTREYVYGFFTKELLMSNDTAEILTDIVTYEGSIPTGSPASQLIAFYAYLRMFHEIEDVARRKHRCIFSLYVDDMTFSSTTPFSESVLRKEVDIILRKYGHKPSYGKTNYYSRNKAKPVTGVTISSDHELLIPNSLHRKIKMDSIPVLVQGAKLSSTQIKSLNGRIKAARIIKKHAFPELNKVTQKILNEL